MAPAAGRPRPGLLHALRLRPQAPKQEPFLRKSFLEDSRLDGSSPQWGFTIDTTCNVPPDQLGLLRSAEAQAAIDVEDLSRNEVWRGGKVHHRAYDVIRNSIPFH